MTLPLVSIVGAGPGDPDLLTVRALRRIEAADLILFDDLVGPAILALAGHAQRMAVRGRAGSEALDQAAIGRLMISNARRGRRVVRLKGGDPFVLGRGGEEAIALAAAGIPFEIVPGVSSSIAAPALAGIPVTHRGIASGFAVVNGHDPSSEIFSAIEPHSLTLVVLMGLKSRGAIRRALVARGWRHDTPAAIVVSGSMPEQWVWSGTLDGLDAELPPERTGPGTLVIGDVVRLRSLIDAGEIGEMLEKAEVGS
jgi:uroporphyrin-III C-methyltransferase / precorrin-2 dehydrogenase / sirohydrochlorin ferrochelatase